MQDLRSKLQELIRKRDAMESEITGISARLNAPGQPGLSGGLLDKEVSVYSISTICRYLPFVKLVSIKRFRHKQSASTGSAWYLVKFDRVYGRMTRYLTSCLHHHQPLLCLQAFSRVT